MLPRSKSEVKGERKVHAISTSKATANMYMVLSSRWRAALVAQTVKDLPVMLETQVRSLGQEDPLEKGMATHSSNLAWRMTARKSVGFLRFPRVPISASLVAQLVKNLPAMRETWG